ncbi:MAG: sorbitol dehydrogenase [Armatimonadota bacterium]|nr:MAG: sorbitol dehydrogenase [Armatimonadota bacterium]
MRALVVPQKGKLEVRDIPEPRLGPYDARVRIEVCGICNSTDLKLIDGTMFWAPPFPFVLGHESVGEVVEVGPRVRKFKVGDRVTRPCAFVPGSVPELNLAVGGFAEYGVLRDGFAMAEDGDSSLMDDYNVLRQNVVPQGIEPIQAALAITLAETASVLNRLPNVRGKTVVVAGTGAVGLAFGLWIKLAGGSVITLGRRKERLELALKLGADHVVDTTRSGWTEQIVQLTNGGADGAIEATGDADLAARLLDVLKPGAFASAYGVPPTGTSYPEGWVPSDVREQESYDWVCDLIIRGWIDPGKFITHTWTLDQAQEAFRLVAGGEVLKGFVKLSV